MGRFPPTFQQRSQPQSDLLPRRPGGYGRDHSAQDALLSYGNGGNGKWELRSANAATFNSKLAKNSTWMSTVNYTVPLDTLHLFTIDFDVNSSTSSMWVNGTLVNASTPDPIGLAEKQRITLMGNRANPPSDHWRQDG